MAIHKILVPIDFSECSERALQWALSLAERVVRHAPCSVLVVRTPVHA